MHVTNYIKFLEIFFPWFGCRWSYRMRKLSIAKKRMSARLEMRFWKEPKQTPNQGSTRHSRRYRGTIITPNCLCHHKLDVCQAVSKSSYVIRWFALEAYSLTIQLIFNLYWGWRIHDNQAPGRPTLLWKQIVVKRLHITKQDYRGRAWTGDRTKSGKWQSYYFPKKKHYCISISKINLSIWFHRRKFIAVLILWWSGARLHTIWNPSKIWNQQRPTFYNRKPNVVYKSLKSKQQTENYKIRHRKPETEICNYTSLCPCQFSEID